LWEVEAEGVSRLLKQAGEGDFAALSADAERMLVTSGNTAELRNAGGGTVVLEGHDDAVISAALSPDGAMVATASADQTARLWDAADGSEIAVLEHPEPLAAVSFAPDASRLVVASSAAIHVWDAGRHEELAVFPTGANKAEFSPDGSRILIAGADGTALLLDAATGSELLVVGGQAGTLYDATFSQDGSQILTAFEDGTARLWDAQSGEQLAVLSGHTDYVYAATFSPDGSRIATASADNSIRLWDASRATEIGRLLAPEPGVNAVRFFPDGRELLTASRDGSMRIWPIFPTTQELVDHARSIMPRELTPEQRREFFLE
jgi:WD40 repeat protein